MKMKQNTSHAVMSQRMEAKDSADDFPTPPWATRALIEHAISEPAKLKHLTCWEPACGEGHMAKVLADHFEIAKLIKKRKGYVNYYFNELNRDRTWDAFLAHGSFVNASGTWEFRGQIVEGADLEITMDDKQIVGDFPGAPVTVDVSKDRFQLAQVAADQ